MTLVVYFCTSTYQLKRQSALTVPNEFFCCIYWGNLENGERLLLDDRVANDSDVFNLTFDHIAYLLDEALLLHGAQ